MHTGHRGIVNMEFYRELGVLLYWNIQVTYCNLRRRVFCLAKLLSVPHTPVNTLADLVI